MISRWLKYIAHGNDSKAAVYAASLEKSASFGPFWIRQVEDEAIIIGMPVSAWKTTRGMYQRGDIRKAIPIVMQMPAPAKISELVCCVWTRKEDLAVPLQMMAVIPDEPKDPPGTDTAKYEAAVLWNWIGHVTRQKTRTQKTGGLIKEFNKWLGKTEVTLPAIRS